MIQAGGSWRIFYALTKDQAIEDACEMFECTVDEIEAVSRVQHFDKYVGEDIPFLELIENGTIWLSCPECGVRIDELLMNFPKNKRLEPIEIQDTHDVFCSEECLVTHCKGIARELH